MKIATDKAKIEELLTRGVDQVVDKAHLKKQLLSGKKLRVKLGIDPTSPNLHLGRGVALLKLRDFQELGHQLIFIVGDFTGVIGDTSDKFAERPMLDEKTVKANLKTYIEQAGKLIDTTKAEVEFNSKWLSKLSFADIAKMADAFSLHEFIARKNIKDRLDKGSRVSLRELLYPLMQGYDSVAIKADVELGGSDQWFNLLAGRTLQAYFGQPAQNIITNNLILGTDGRKMSSSWGNTINFTDSPEDMFGKVMSIPDEQIISYFEHCTRVPLLMVRQFAKQLEAGRVNPRDIKLSLALEITTLFWGNKKAATAQDYFERVFSKKETPHDLAAIKANGKSIVEALVLAKLVMSKGEARRVIEQGGVEIDGKKISRLDIVLKTGSIIKKGKKGFVRIK